MAGECLHQKLPQQNLQLLDQFHRDLTFYYGKLPYLMNMDSEEATNLRSKRRPALYSIVLPHPPAPVVEEVHRQGQSWARGP